MMRLSRSLPHMPSQRLGLALPGQRLGLALQPPRRALLSTLSTKLATPNRTTVKMIVGTVVGVSVAGLARTSKEESSSRCHRLAVGRAWATAATALPALHSCEGSHLSG